MAGHDLINDYLSALDRRLPTEVVEELADGLHEAYRAHLLAEPGSDAAARAAISEFGPVDALVGEFVRTAPGRRAARALLLAGPPVGTCWGVALISSSAWTDVPGATRVAFGVVLATVLVALVLAATARRTYRRTQAGGVAAAALLLDGTAVAGTLLLVHPPSGLLLATALSLTRMAFTAHILARITLR